ncbi:MAG TPA: ABC transporter ATP-binding protein [Anaerolineae bacterium]|nr:ABC transporter ATP-binding protein [Anaerolineae bacterium]HQJ11476.1 ABC transporter ATP-binding protein [Anaerolineae bacterium]
MSQPIHVSTAHRTSAPALSVQGLTITYQAKRGDVQAVRNVSFDVGRGEALAIIGESGSGKTTLGLGIVRLLPSTATIRQGELLYRRFGAAGNGGGTSATSEVDVLQLKGRDLRQFRWKECAMVFQAALNAFNPVLRVSDQFGDTARAHGYLQGRELADRARHLFELVRLDSERVWRAYPHELSGGMRQRVLIALGLLLEPQLLILDEPTTALDILTQRNIMDVLKDLRQKLDFSLIFISHDLSLAAELADRVATMYAGKLVELSDVYTTFKNPVHPYTIGLIHAVPTLTAHRDHVSSIPGSPPDLIDLPSGCKFHPRCPLADQRCREEEPELAPASEAHHWVACWNWQSASDRLHNGQKGASA